MKEDTKAARAYWRGWAARLDGRTRNPYWYNRKLHAAWTRGWRDCQRGESLVKGIAR